MTRVCRNCGATYEDWVEVCPDCGTALGPRAQGEEQLELERTVSIEFTLLSGETISVRHTFEEPATEEAVRSYAEGLVHELGTDTVRTFVYWWEGEFYVDAVRLREVAAVSVSTLRSEEEEWEGG